MPGRRTLASTGALEVLSRTSLSSKQSLVLVRMGRRLLLLGVTGDEMITLCVVEDPDQVATMVGEVASGRFIAFRFHKIEHGGSAVMEKVDLL